MATAQGTALQVARRSPAQKNCEAGPSEPGGGGLEPPNNCHTVVCVLYNSVLNEKETNGTPPYYESHYDGTVKNNGPTYVFGPVVPKATADYQQLLSTVIFL